MQASFSKGEISPLLHARVDLAAYSTGLAELKNMIVLPQGGITRRAGFVKVRYPGGDICRVIPFVFNETDTALINFKDSGIAIYGNISGEFTQLASLTSPYNGDDVQDLNYVQSGNVIFLAHRKYPPKMLVRNSLYSWTLKDIEFRGGPFIDSAEWGATKPLTIERGVSIEAEDPFYVLNSSENIFKSTLVGTLVKLEYPMPAVNESLESYGSTTLSRFSKKYEVKGTLNVVTTGENWKGRITIQRSSDDGETWVTVRQYIRTDPQTQGQWDFTISESDDNIVYRVGAAHEPDNPKVTVNITVSGFLKNDIFKIIDYESAKKVYIRLQNSTGFTLPENLSATTKVTLWSMGAWGKYQGYPGAIAMYQDRLVFASSKLQPQTIWLSRTGDYSDFSISSTLKDDDAVTITLAGSSADGIHSLVTTTDLLAFTISGEWKIRGAGDNGAITPSAFTAHQQTNIGTKNIRPIVADGRIIIVQAQGEKVFSLGYDLNSDGYTGSELTILSSHIFEGKQIISTAYQRMPDSLIWVLFDDGTFASCTFNPEHEVIGWARHETGISELQEFLSVPGARQTELFLISGIKIYRAEARLNTAYTDDGVSFESIIRTLRININAEDGNLLTNKKLISRIVVSTLKSESAWAAPGGLNDANNWERRRKINFDNTDYLTDSEIQLDNGFDEYACVQIRSIDNQPLTVAAITPVVTIGSR